MYAFASSSGITRKFLSLSFAEASKYAFCSGSRFGPASPPSESSWKSPRYTMLIPSPRNTGTHVGLRSDVPRSRTISFSSRWKCPVTVLNPGTGLYTSSCVYAITACCVAWLPVALR